MGLKGPRAAFIPKPVGYLTNIVYSYDAGRDEVTPLDNKLVSDVSAEVSINIAQLSWITEQPVPGGRLAFSGIMPYGNVEVSGDVSPCRFDISDSDSVMAFGDPVQDAGTGLSSRGMPLLAA